MKKILSLSVMLLFLTTILAQQRNVDSPLRSLVLTEQGFSKMAELQGTREAFLAFIADDGVLFRPNAVNGKQWMLAHPVQPSPKRSLLAWQPRIAEVSNAGDLGYTTGPWEFKDDIKNEKPSAFGDFITVWKKQSDGLWKFAVDLGVSHPGSSGPLEVWRVPNASSSGKSSNADTSTELIAVDSAYVTAAERDGTAKAFAANAAINVRMYRDGSNPFVGKAAAVENYSSRNEKFDFKPDGNGVSTSGDLGYVYGRYEATTPTETKPEHGNFLRIWKKQGAAWKIVIEVNSGAR